MRTYVTSAEALEALRYSMSVHFAETEPFTVYEADIRFKMTNGAVNSKLRQEASKNFDEIFGGYIRSVMRDELKRLFSK